MVDFDIMPSAASHAKAYANFSSGLLAHTAHGLMISAPAHIPRTSTAFTWKSGNLKLLNAIEKV
jgi:hypothetical protein